MPPKNLLAALDGSAPSESALKHAIDLARALGAGVSGLFVKDVVVLDAYLLGDLPGMMGASPITQLKTDFDRLFEARGAAVLAEAEKVCAASRTPFSGSVESGRIGPLVLAASKLSELVAMGIWGAGSDGRSVGGHVLSALGSCPKPVLVAPSDYHKIERVVVAYDDSAPSRRVLKLASKLAKAAGWPVEAVIVSDDPKASRYLDRAGKAAPGAKLKRLKGEPRPVLRKLAAEGKGILLAMGTHGHGYIHSMVLGSTTHHVLQGTAVPVLFAR